MPSLPRSEDCDFPAAPVWTRDAPESLPRSACQGECCMTLMGRIKGGSEADRERFKEKWKARMAELGLAP